MMDLLRHRLAALALAACVPAMPSAWATGGSCSVTGATTASIGNYNPFTSTGFNQVPITLNLTRYASGGHKTQKADFYLAQPAGSPAGVQVLSQGANVLYTRPATQPLNLSPSPGDGTVYYDFGGNGGPDTVPIPLLVTIPAGADLSSGAPLVFDIVYICRGNGGLTDVLIPTTLASAITITVNVASALQASYAGPAFDFGEVGSLTDLQALTHRVAGMVRVASSGPFVVAMSSQNTYRMTYPGGNVGSSSQSIKYAAGFLGQVKDSVDGNFLGVACNRSGLGGQYLPITVTLQEGGLAKVPASNYRDTITVTVTPLAISYGGTSQACASLQ